MKGCDYAWERPSVQALKDAGIGFACRYLGYDNTGKNLTADEAASLHAAGIAIVLNFEYNPDGALGGHAQGVADAALAKQQRAQLGAPDSTPVYFSVDFNTTDIQLRGSVADYFRGVATVLPLAQIGVYGSYLTVQALMGGGLVSLGWQAYAWSDGRWGGAQLRQVQNGVTVGGVSLDIDESVSTYFGQWLPDNTVGGAMSAGFGFDDQAMAEVVAWRLDALASGSTTVRGGPTAGETMAINVTLAEIAAKLSAIYLPASTPASPLSGTMSGTLSGTVTLTPTTPTVPSGR